MDWESIAAGLLHDTVEDTNVVTFERIEEEFGPTVRHIVEGETKVLYFLWVSLCFLVDDIHLTQTIIVIWAYIDISLFPLLLGIQIGKIKV